MKYINLGIELTDDLALKSFAFIANDTGLPNDSKLLQLLAFALLKAIHINQEDLELQDLLNKLGISKL